MESPQLMIAPTDPNVRLSPTDAKCISERLKELKTGSNDVIFAFPVNIWQFVDGRWEALQNSPQEVPDGAEVIRS